MKAVLCYPVPNETPEVWATFKPFVQRFAASLKQFDAGHEFDLRLVLSSDQIAAEMIDAFLGMPATAEFYPGGGWDIGAAQWLSKKVEGFQICFTTRGYIHRSDWLKRLMEERERHGPGVYGMSASNQFTPHICFRGMATDAGILARYPVEIRSRYLGHYFESGPRNFTVWAESNFIPTWVVTFNGIYGRRAWNEVKGAIDAPNGFRNGDQSAMLAFDKHSDLYRDAQPHEKRELERITRG